MTLHCFAPGIPQPQGSTRVFTVGGVPRITTDNDRLKPWRKSVVVAASNAALSQHWVTALGAIRLDLFFVMPRGTTVKRPLPTVRPDLDKLTRAVMDALTYAGVYRDDAQVIRLAVSKAYVDPDSPLLAVAGVRVSVTTYEGSPS